MPLMVRGRPRRYSSMDGAIKVVIVAVEAEAEAVMAAVTNPSANVAEPQKAEKVWRSRLGAAGGAVGVCGAG